MGRRVFDTPDSLHQEHTSDIINVQNVAILQSALILNHPSPMPTSLLHRSSERDVIT